MRGLKSEDLEAIVDFLYYGEANIYQDNLDTFLIIAQELNLKGLDGNESHETQTDASKTIQTIQTNTPKRIQLFSARLVL